MFIKYIVSFLVFLAFTLSNSVFAAGSNAILSTSVRKTATDGLSLTFFTKSENSEQPIVKDKGNNQYVILLPNLQDTTGRIPDLRAVSDMVSDVNIKTINEGAVTYTKVSVTTKKPVKINAETRRTTQSAGELAGVNDIISKVSLINQDIQASKSAQPVKTPPVVAVATTTPAMPKVTSVQDILKNKNSIGIMPAVDVKKEIKPSAPVVTSVAPTTSVAAHVPANTKSIKKETKKLQNENIRNVRLEATRNIDKIEQNIKSSVENNVTVNDDESVFEDSIVEAEPENALVQEIVPEPKKSFSVSDLLSSPLSLILLFGVVGLLVAVLILNLTKSALNDSEEMNTSFVERMNSAIPSTKKDYTHIAQNENLNWQEKYSSFKEGKSKEQLAQLQAHIGADPDEDLDIVDDYEMVDESLPVIVEDSIEPANPFAAASVWGEGDEIANSMKRTLKSFADERSLYQVQRNTGLQNRFKSFENDAVLGLQRNINELLDTVIKMDEEKPMQANSDADFVHTVESAPQIVSDSIERKTRAHASSPIQKAQAPSKRKMKIKESRAIDDNKGFYLVDMEDKLALMGRINDKFTVLKKFDDKEKKTLQVRRDKDNLYMVRTDGFKALVDVAENKMGVLAEL